MLATVYTVTPRNAPLHIYFAELNNRQFQISRNIMRFLGMFLQIFVFARFVYGATWVEYYDSSSWN